MAMRAKVRRGLAKGAPLYPHQHEDGSYVVSPTRYEKDYERVGNIDVAERKVREEGLRIRMSRPGHPPSLICPASIEFL